MIIRTGSTTTIQELLCAKLAISKSKAKRILDSKRVTINGKRVWIASYKVRPNDNIELLNWEETKKPVITSQYQIIFEDDYLLVCNKPAGIATTGRNSLEEIINKNYPDEIIYAIHRLDRDTSGAVIFSKSNKVKEAFIEQFRAKSVKKIYLTILIGSVAKQRKMNTAIENEEALSIFTLKKQGPAAALVEVEIITGKKHQIRIHALEMGNPVVGDKEYGKITPETKNATRQMLHAYTLAFNHPVTNQKISIEAALPKDFEQMLRYLQLT